MSDVSIHVSQFSHQGSSVVLVGAIYCQRIGTTSFATSGTRGAILVVAWDMIGVGVLLKVGTRLPAISSKVLAYM